jgi:hypothetical protein
VEDVPFQKREMQDSKRKKEEFAVPLKENAGYANFTDTTANSVVYILP